MENALRHGWIKHVIYLMLENRGFDHFLGWLYPPGGPAPGTINSYNGDARAFLGLSDADILTLTNPYPKNLAAPQPVIKGARSPKTPSYNSGENFPHIMNQMWGVDDASSSWETPDLRGVRLRHLMGQNRSVPPMNGYILDFNFELNHLGITQPDTHQLSEIVETYLPEQLPVLSGLARSFAVSDEWYCSVPSQTNTNRAFSLTGTSRGMVNNGFYPPHTVDPLAKFTNWIKEFQADALPRSTGSLFEVLQASGFSWKVYWQAEWPPRAVTTTAWQYTRTLIPALDDAQFDDNFIKFDAADDNNALFKAISDGTLPALTYIEPKWSGGHAWDVTVKSGPRLVGNEFHPVSDVTVGEEFLRRLYDVLAASDPAGEILLIVTFDENGGTYDHMPPPAAVAPENQSVPLPHIPRTKLDVPNAISVTAQAVTADPDVRTQFGFDFKQYGIRVPTILVSNRLAPGTVFRSTQRNKVFDHTSIIASILEMAAIPRPRWLLGERVLQAPTFTHLFTGAPPAITARPYPFKIAARPSTGAVVQANTPYRLAYVGSLWPQPGDPVYLGPKAWGFREYYPTLTGANLAAPYRLLPVARRADGAIANMSKIRIAIDAPSQGPNAVLSANWTNPNVFLSPEGTTAGEIWEIRLLQSRDSQDMVRIDDYVVVFSCLPPPAGPRNPDPFQRLMPDPGNPKYTTTAAGEWALWQVQALPLG